MIDEAILPVDMIRAVGRPSAKPIKESRVQLGGPFCERGLVLLLVPLVVQQLLGGGDALIRHRLSELLDRATVARHDPYEAAFDQPPERAAVGVHDRVAHRRALQEVAVVDDERISGDHREDEMVAQILKLGNRVPVAMTDREVIEQSAICAPLVHLLLSACRYVRNSGLAGVAIPGLCLELIPARRSRVPGALRMARCRHDRSGRRSAGGPMGLGVAWSSISAGPRRGYLVEGQATSGARLRSRRHAVEAARAQSG